MNDPRLDPPAPSTEDATPEPEQTFPVANRADRRAWRHAIKVRGRRLARERDQRTAARNR